MLTGFWSKLWLGNSRIPGYLREEESTSEICTIHYSPSHDHDDGVAVPGDLCNAGFTCKIPMGQASQHLLLCSITTA